MNETNDLLARASKVKLFVTDVDGVWTDASVYLDVEGRETMRFQVRDGLGVKLLQRAGVEIVVISGRTAAPLVHRATQLGVDDLHLGHLDKADVVREVIESRGLSKEQVAAIGDDIIDHALFDAAGIKIAVLDADPSLIERADYVTSLPGGYGALREACDLLRRSQEEGS